MLKLAGFTDEVSRRFIVYKVCSLKMMNSFWAVKRTRARRHCAPLFLCRYIVELQTKLGGMGKIN